MDAKSTSHTARRSPFAARRSLHTARDAFSRAALAQDAGAPVAAGADVADTRSPEASLQDAARALECATWAAAPG